LRYFIEIAYKGTNFHGWQIQPKAISVQETIQKGLQQLLGKKIDITGAGRTDAGVHAQQIFAHFDLEEKIKDTNFTYRLNAVLPETIVIKKLLSVKPKAHARFDALDRSYEYHIHLAPNPFLLDITWQIHHKKIDVKLMNQAAIILLKHTNFKAFSKSKTDVKNYNCTITQAFWTVKDKQLVFMITANRFLRNMVRAIVGTLLEVGTQKINLEQFEQIILSQNRSEAGVSVPAKGLFLTQVTYPKSIFKR
jgi:tRNA pseudouridine38-40 synthase